MGEGYRRPDYRHPLIHRFPVEKLGAIIRNTRPYTLLAPLVGGFGIMVGAATFTGTYPWVKMIAAAVVFALLNGAGNHVNSIYDQPIDEVNKPYRPLVKGTLSEESVHSLAIVLYVLAALLASLINRWFMLFMFVLFVFSLFYSIPPLRMKKRLWLNNLWQAASRGLFGTVAAWSVVANPIHPIPWAFGVVTGIWMVGAQTTKDFPDMEGDAQFDIRTLPVVYGEATANYLMGLFIATAFLVLGGFILLEILPTQFIAYIILTVPSAVILLTVNQRLERLENTAAWVSMYLTLAAWYVGFPILLHP